VHHLEAGVTSKQSTGYENQSKQKSQNVADRRNSRFKGLPIFDLESKSSYRLHMLLLMLAES